MPLNHWKINSYKWVGLGQEVAQPEIPAIAKNVVYHKL